MIDTSTWLDLAKQRDGRRLLIPLRNFVLQGWLKLLVPELIIDEFERNRPKVEAQMTTSVAERFKLIRRDLVAYGPPGPDTLNMLDQLAREVPLVGAMTMQNFDDIRELLEERSTRLVPTAADHEGVVSRGLTKTAPLHNNRNSVADALLIELYSSALEASTPDDRFVFVTTNSEDFSAVGGDQRLPHNDLAPIFQEPRSTFRLGVKGLDQVLNDEFGNELAELLSDEILFVRDEPRRLDEILDAEQEIFDRIWYDRSARQEQEAVDAGDQAQAEQIRKIAAAGRARVEAAYGTGNLGPYNRFEWGMLNGKLSALRWVVGEEWDLLDT